MHPAENCESRPARLNTSDSLRLAGARYPAGRGMRRLPFESNCLPIVCQFANWLTLE